jgi:hypothetical protein
MLLKSSWFFFNKAAPAVCAACIPSAHSEKITLVVISFFVKGGCYPMLLKSSWFFF